MLNKSIFCVGSIVTVATIPWLEVASVGATVPKIAVITIHEKSDRYRRSDKIFCDLSDNNLGIFTKKNTPIANSLETKTNLNERVAQIPPNTKIKASNCLPLIRAKERTEDENKRETKAAIDFINAELAESNRAIQLAPNNYKAYLDRGNLKKGILLRTNALFKKKILPQDVLADYNRAIQLASNQSNQNGASFSLSQAYLARADFKATILKDLQGALADYNRAVRFAPNQSNQNDDSFSLGRAYLARADFKATILKDLQGALDDYDLAVRVYPFYAYKRGIFKATILKDLQGALADLNRAIQQQPDSEFLYIDRGSVFYELGNIIAAAKDWQKTIDLTGGYAFKNASIGLVVIAYKQGDRSKAIDLLYTKLGYFKHGIDLENLRYIREEIGLGDKLRKDAAAMFDCGS